MNAAGQISNGPAEQAVRVRDKASQRTVKPRTTQADGADGEAELGKAGAQ